MKMRNKVLGAVAAGFVAVVMLATPALAVRIDTWSRNNGHGASGGGTVYDEGGWVSINGIAKDISADGRCATLVMKRFDYYLGVPTPGAAAEWTACGNGTNTGIHQLKISHNSTAQAVRFEASICSRVNGVTMYCSFYTSRKVDL